MAINPLQLPKWEPAPKVDWSPIGDIGQAIADRRQRERLQEAAAASTGPDGQVALGQFGARALAAGDVQAGLAAARLAEAQAEREATNARADRAAASLDQYRRDTLETQRRAYEQARVPAGFRPGEGGTLEPVPGGPADPSYLGEKTARTRQPRQFTASDVGKLSEEGAKLANLSGFADTFKDTYAGYGSSWLGNAANAAGRYLPESTSRKIATNAPESAEWWQGYDRYKNVVRNELFGSALTATEQDAFEKADINPGMTPAQIRANLARQKEIAETGMRRKAGALAAAGYPVEVIGKAYGLDPNTLTGAPASQPATGQTPPPGRARSVPAQPQAGGGQAMAPLPPAATTPTTFSDRFGAQFPPAFAQRPTGNAQVDAVMAQGRDAIARGADPRKVEERILQILQGQGQGR